MKVKIQTVAELDLELNSMPSNAVYACTRGLSLLIYYAHAPCSTRSAIIGLSLRINAQYIVQIRSLTRFSDRSFTNAGGEIFGRSVPMLQ